MGNAMSANVLRPLVRSAPGRVGIVAPLAAALVKLRWPVRASAFVIAAAG